MDIANTNTTDNTDMIIDDENDVLNLLRNDPYIQWDQVLIALQHNKQLIHLDQVLMQLRKRIECIGASQEVLDQLIEMFPRELAFSLFLSVMRFLGCSSQLFQKIVNAIKNDPHYHMGYCIRKFNGDAEKEKTVETVIGELLTLQFSFFDDYIATSQSGNLAVIQWVRQTFPDSVLYVDGHEFTALHGACCALNMEIIKYYIEWHAEQNPNGRGGLYAMNDSGITPMDTLIDTQQNLVPILTWFCNHGLLRTRDVSVWLLVHRSAHSSSISTIRFFLQLYPSGVLVEDDDGNLPIHLHLGLRYRPRGTFSEQDFEIVKLFLSYGIINGGINTIGGLFHSDPDVDGQACTLTMLLERAGETNVDRIWQIIDECLNEAGPYENAPIVHAAIKNKQHIPNDLFRQILNRYGATNLNDRHELPLSYGVRIGAKWSDCVSHVLECHKEAIGVVDQDTGLPILPFAALQEGVDLETIYEFSKQSLNIFLSVK
jgi:hypothetical protein